MIPEITLEHESFEDMVQEYRQVITNIYPEWTNFNPHDPGMTLMELFVWMKSVHSFEMDQITDRHYKKYLGLLGMEQQHGRPATCVIRIQPDEDMTLFRGTRFFAGQICFENDRPGNLYRTDICACICQNGEDFVTVDNMQLRHDGRLVFYPFGVPAAEGGICYLQLGEPLQKQGINHLTYLAAGKYQSHRIPVDEHSGFVPLAEIALEVFTPEGWKPCSIKEDTTCGLIQDGTISFENSYECAQTEVEHVSGYFLRMVLHRSQYETAPGCAGIGLNWVKVRQKETWAVWEEHTLERGQRIFRSEHSLAQTGRSELLWKKTDGSLIPCGRVEIEKMQDGSVQYTLLQEAEAADESILLLLYEPEFDNLRFPGTATGFPNQSYDLQTDRILCDSFDLCVEDIGNPGTFRMWTCVDDFDSSGPEDFHYQLDTAEGMLRFGDGFHGMMPEGRIVIAGYSLFMGEEGNIKAGRFKNREHFQVASHFDACGGCGEESIEDCFIRLKEELKTVDRAVTAADYETLLHQIPGLVIEACKVITGDELERTGRADRKNQVGIVVKPYSDCRAPVLTESYRKNIEQYLRPRILLGTSVKLYAPSVVRVSVYGDLVAKAQYYNARETIESRVAQFFEQRGHRFGAPVLYADLYRLLISLDCVKGIGRLTLEGRGNGAVSQSNGDIYLPPYGIAVLQELSFQIITE